MNLSHSNISCGVNQLANLSVEPMEGLRFLGLRMFSGGWKHAFIIWSDGVSKGRGESLYKLIKKTFPKSNIQKTEDVLNPNSLRYICLYNWQVPVIDFRAWWNDNNDSVSK